MGGSSEIAASSFIRVMADKSGQGRPLIQRILFAVFRSVTSLIGWAVGYQGIKLMTTDGGMNWIQVFQDTASNVFNTKVQCLEPRYVLGSRIADYGDYFGGGVLWKCQSDTSGSNWQSISPWSMSGLIFTIADFEFVSKNTGWATKMDALGFDWVSQVSKTTNGGLTWTSNRIPSIGFISFSDTSSGYLISDGQIYAYVDSANTFVHMADIGSYYGGGAICAIGNAIYASSHSAIMKSTDGGKQWAQQSDYGDGISTIEFINPEIGWAVGDNGSILHTNNGGLTSVATTKTQIEGFDLEPNYPNPFNPTTTISFTLATKSVVSLKAFDLLGRQVATLVDASMPEGRYTRQWNAVNQSSGAYFCRLQTESFTKTIRLILVR